MSKDYRKIRFITNEYTRSQEIVRESIEIIKNKSLALEIVEDDSANVIIPVGGDGAFLKACKETGFNTDLVYVGINTGTVGFLQSVEVKLLEKLLIILSVWMENYRMLPLLDITFQFEDCCKEFKAINELEVAGHYNKIFDFKQYVDGSFFNEARASGVIVSTSTGSTGLNKSFGGPILLLDDAIVSTIMGAIKGVPNSIIAKSTEIIFPSIESQRAINPSFNRFRNKVFFSIDGSVIDEIDTNKLISIKISISEEKLKVVNFDNLTIVDIIREKLL